MTTWICILSSTWDTCSSGRRGGYTFFQTILLMYLCWVHSVSLLLLFSLLSFLGKTNYCLVLHVLLCHECLELSAYDLTCAYLRVLIISILRPLNCAWNARRVCDATDTLRCLHDLSCHAFSLYLCIEWISLCFCPNVVHLTVRCLFDQTRWWHWCHSPFSASMATFVQIEWMNEWCIIRNFALLVHLASPVTPFETWRRWYHQGCNTFSTSLQLPSSFFSCRGSSCQCSL